MYRSALLFIAACASAAAPPASTPRSPELNKLMNDQVNPSFSKLSFSVFHGEEGQRLDVKPAQTLAAATARVATWPDPPVSSPEGADVFRTYAAAFDRDAQRLVRAIGANDRAAASQLVDHIAETCNNCHHFFRLAIKDTIVSH